MNTHTDFYVPLYHRGNIVAWTVINTFDVPLTIGHRWLLLKANTGFYAGRYAGGATILLHRLILGLVKGDGLESDHKDRDRLNNRRDNLRVVTRAQNNQNRGLLQNNTSGYRGVTWFHPASKWMAYVQANGKQKTLGYFSTKEEAARVASAARRVLLPFSIEDS